MHACMQGGSDSWRPGAELCPAPQPLGQVAECTAWLGHVGEKRDLTLTHALHEDVGLRTHGF